METVIKKINQGVLDGEREDVVAAVKEALAGEVSAERILKEGMMPAMAESGRLFEEGEYFVPELLVAARAMQGGMEVLKPYLVAEDVEPVGKVVLGTVKGDLHDIGKNLVAMMMEGAGFEVTDLGTDVSAEQFVAGAKEAGAQIVGLSALLTTTMVNMPKTVEAFNAAGLRNQVKIFIGGAPVTQKYADEIGADGYAPDASQAAKLALSMLS